ncbi:hypothetical protein FOZ60_006664 [Perkinsus olseni]|uniref:Uncharacterized protein n=1 Tax=Perkinsus olseni TaxID=32597 RepID=A0A7J6NNN1_PEROL|nr:hypothetical protein FOZ60_006664 [Perkinsus olseni]
MHPNLSLEDADRDERTLDVRSRVHPSRMYLFQKAILWQVRYIRRLAEREGVLHLLSASKSEEASDAPKVGMGRVKHYTSQLSLSQRQLEKLTRDVNRDADTAVFPSRASIRASVSDYQTKFCIKDNMAVPVGMLQFVCHHFGLSTSSSSSNSADDEDTLVVGLDFGGGTTKAVVRPYGRAGGHGCLVVLHGGKDTRDVTCRVISEIEPLTHRFRLLYASDNKELQFLAGTSSNACWLCSAVEKRSNNRCVYPLQKQEDRWEKALERASLYREKCDSKKRPPAHVNGQKFAPLVPKESLLLSWLHILMGICRNLFDQMIRLGTERKDLERTLKEKLHINPTKPIVGSTLEKTNVLAFSGKDCLRLLQDLAAVKVELESFPAGRSVFMVLQATEKVRKALMTPNSQSLVETSIAQFEQEYVNGGFNPSLVIHILVTHGLELYSRHSTHGLRLLTEELGERIHSQVNIVMRRSQLKDDLLKQISMWNWQYSGHEPQETSTPRPKRARKPTIISPQVVLSGFSSAKPRANRAVDPDYVESGGD